MARVRQLIAFVLRCLIKLVLGVVLLASLLVIVKIPWVYHYYPDGQRLFDLSERSDIVKRRAYLISHVQGALFTPSSMPSAIGRQFQGEWAVVTCSMATAALTNIAFQFPETRKESLTIVRGLINQMLTEEFRAYDAEIWGQDPIESLSSDQGHIGYLGHLNLMIGAYRLLGGGGEFDTLHREISRAMLSRLEDGLFPYLETYPGEIYTADNTVVMASLRLFDLIYQEDHQDLFSWWIDYTSDNLLDRDTGLIIFGVDAKGRGQGGARGSAAGWNSFYLPFVDRQFAHRQFLKAKDSLLQTLPFKALGLREYPRGVDAFGDIDSGPLVFGLSPSGTGFIVAGARHAQERETYQGLLLSAEIVGSSLDVAGRRRYLVAPLVGDAIMLAMKTAQVWDDRYLRNTSK